MLTLNIVQERLQRKRLADAETMASSMLGI